jgi:hypothetical protein
MPASMNARSAYVGVPRTADPRARGDALASVEASRRGPRSGCHEVVGVLVLPPSSRNFGRAVGLLRAVLGGIEEEVRRRRDPDASEAELHAADEVEVVHEDGALRIAAVALDVLEDEDAVPSLPEVHSG